MEVLQEIILLRVEWLREKQGNKNDLQVIWKNKYHHFPDGIIKLSPLEMS